MEARRIEIFPLLRAGLKNTEISKQLNVNRMTVHRVERRLNASKFAKDHP